MGILGMMMISLMNTILVLLATLVIAALTLLESKMLSLTQRSMGPLYVGYSGRLQYIADALKLFGKSAIMPNEVNKFWYVVMPSIVLSICYTFWINSIWGPDVCMYEMEYNLVMASVLSMMFSICMMLTGYFSKNKYAFMSSMSSMYLVINLEIFLNLMVMSLLPMSNSFCLMNFVIYQETFYLVMCYSLMVGLFFITFLLEVNRAPFDLAEAESELIAGYTVELGGFYFGVYYLGEYFHLFFFSNVIVLLMFGGWEPMIFFYKLNYLM